MHFLYFARKSLKVTRQSLVELSPAGCLAGALMVLVLPFKLLISAVLAATIHECFHILALMLCKNQIRRIRVGFGGAVIETELMTPLQELFCAAAGPIGSFLCLLMVRFMPLVALCALFQGLFNLLPIHSLDGGRILHCVCILLVPRWADRISHAFSILTCMIVICIFIWLYFRFHHLILLLFAGYFLYSTALCRKTPCKEGGY